MDEKVNASPSWKQKVTDFSQKYKLGAFFQKYTMIIALVVVTIVFANWKGKEGMILLPSNLTGLIAENAYVFVLATGMLMCILTGGNIDLSVGSVVCFTAAVGCVMMASGINMWLAILVMLLIGLAIGTFQGFWIAKLRVPAFIATLSGMYAFRGFSNVVLNGYRVDITNQTFLQLFGNGKTSYIPDVLRDKLPNRRKLYRKIQYYLYVHRPCGGSDLCSAQDPQDSGTEKAWHQPVGSGANHFHGDYCCPDFVDQLQAELLPRSPDGADLGGACAGHLCLHYE